MLCAPACSLQHERPHHGAHPAQGRPHPQGCDFRGARPHWRAQVERRDRLSRHRQQQARLQPPLPPFFERASCWGAHRPQLPTGPCALRRTCAGRPPCLPAASPSTWGPTGSRASPATHWRRWSMPPGPGCSPRPPTAPPSSFTRGMTSPTRCGMSPPWKAVRPSPYARELQRRPRLRASARADEHAFLPVNACRSWRG